MGHQDDEKTGLSFFILHRADPAAGFRNCPAVARNTNEQQPPQGEIDDLREFLFGYLFDVVCGQGKPIDFKIILSCVR